MRVVALGSIVLAVCVPTRADVATEQEVKRCLGASPFSPSQIAQCVAKKWDQSIQDATASATSVAVNSCEQQLHAAKATDEKALTDSVERVRSELRQEIDKTRIEEQQRCEVARSADSLQRSTTSTSMEADAAKKGQAMADFFYAFEANSERVGLPIEAVRRGDREGVLVVRRKNSNTVVVPFAAIQSADVETDSKDTRLVLRCGPNDKCVVVIDRNGAMDQWQGIRFVIDQSTASNLLSAAKQAVRAFP